jgi:hypothetical protein
MAGSDETDSYTRVPTVRRAWVPVATSCRARYLMSSFPEVPTVVVHARYRKPLGEATGNPSASQARERDGVG